MRRCVVRSAVLCHAVLGGVAAGFVQGDGTFHGVLVLPRHSCIQGAQHEVVSPLLASR